MNMVNASSIIVRNTLPLVRMDWGDVLAPSGRWSALVHAGAKPETVSRHCTGIAYLATPYTKEVVVRGKWSLERSVYFSAFAARHVVDLMRVDVTAVSPIIIGAEAMAAQGATDGAQLDALDSEFWARWCRPFLHNARAVVVPNIPGWDRSEGIWAEVQFALQNNIPVFVYADRPSRTGQPPSRRAT